MNKAAAKKTTTAPVKEEQVSTQAKEPFTVFSNALLDIGWKLGLLILVPLWLVSRSHKEWFDSAIFGLVAMLWVTISFSLVVYSVLKSIPKSLGGLKK
jgi:hypothetical protein